MKLKTSLQLSAIFPIVFAIFVSIAIGLGFRSEGQSDSLDSLFIAVAGILGLAMAAVILYYSKDILQKIKTLNEWTDTVLKGNLEATVPIDPSDTDEVSRLSYALSKMLRELKGAYNAVYKESVENKQQLVEKQRLADAAQHGTKQLSDALARLRDSQQEIMQKERLNVLEQVIKGVVHDFGEALMPIQGAVDLLMTNPAKLDDKAELQQHLQVIGESIKNARRTLMNLAGIYHVHHEHSEAVDINRVVETTVDLLKPRWKAEANAAGVTIDVRTNLQACPAAAADELDIRDMVTNLLLNAVEAMPSGGTITLSTYADRAAVIFEVSDTGKGMTQEVQKRCIEPFFSTKGEAGAGMGLTIINSLLRRHHGSIRVESDVGRGTRVIVRIPVWSEALKSGNGAEPGQGEGRRLSILLVDDDPMSLKVNCKLLASDGHTVTTAVGGHQGLELIKTNTFDVAIIDKAMPGMDGVALSNAIRDVSSRLPIIMLTGYADIMREEGDVPSNVDILLPKPTPWPEMKKAVTTAAGLKKA